MKVGVVIEVGEDVFFCCEWCLVYLGYVFVVYVGEEVGFVVYLGDYVMVIDIG